MLRHLFVLPFVLVACGDPAPADAKAPKKDKAAAAQAAPGSGPVDEAIAVEWEGGKLSWGELRGEISGEMSALHAKYLMDTYEKQVQAAEGMAMEKVLLAEAQKAGFQTIDDLLKAEIEGKTPAPTEEEIVAFYEQVKRQLGDATLDDARPLLIPELTRRKQGEAYQAYINGVRERAKLKVNVPYPDLPRVEVAVGANDPVLGKPDAKVTIVQFAEYQCYFCNKVAPTLDQIMSTYGDDVRIVFKDYPLQNHGRAVPAAMAAHCADEQGKYWEMNKQLLANQQALEDTDFVRYAEAIGLAMEPWKACYDSGKYRNIVMADMDEGARVGVNATPSFFVNGLSVSGAQPFERFAAVIDRELGR